LTEHGVIRTEEELQALVLYLVYKLKVQVPVPVMEDLIIAKIEDLEWLELGMELDPFIVWFEDHFVVYGVSGSARSAALGPRSGRRPSV